MFGRVVPAADCAIGRRVRPDFADHTGGDTPGWTELYFRVDEPPGTDE